ncbi:hypothetical protein [Arthrobacter sp. A2-55]|uniref:hypothetical protein n=1 Tax=Arthrobacter sp. A2-55 TaxID=2897337 RepID=UPI0021CDB632|nr:hypothetical protein [Arthrobacter sp. A2-55]MCU6480152.1 hypothetical protein [Arthrobacter sp. A2-55]
MKTIPKLATALAISAMLLGGVTACSSDPVAAPTTTHAEDLSAMTAQKAADTITAFVAATTSDQIAAAFPDKADAKTFASAVALVDPKAPSAKAAAAMSDFALLKVTTPKAKVSVDVDASKIVVADRSATVPVAAVVVKEDGKKVTNSAALAANLSNLVFRDGNWLIAFPETPANTSATPSDSAAPSAAATKK